MVRLPDQRGHSIWALGNWLCCRVFVLGCVAAPQDLHDCAQYVPSLIRHLTDRCSESEVSALKLMLSSCPISVASFCAGTDSPRFVWHALIRWCANREVNIKHTHTFSCELSKTKRHFIRVMYGSDSPLYGDVGDLTSDGPPADHRHGENGSLTTPMDPFSFFYGGFPCTDVSSLNNLRNSFRDVIAKGGGSTGKVFGNITTIIKNQVSRPLDDSHAPFVGGVMENVEGLMVGRKHEDGRSVDPLYDLFVSRFGRSVPGPIVSANCDISGYRLRSLHLQTSAR